MRLMCAHCRKLGDREDYVIKESEGKLYGGGRIYQAVHRACKKITFLPAQMVRTAGIAKG